MSSPYPYFCPILSAARRPATPIGRTRHARISNSPQATPVGAADVAAGRFGDRVAMRIRPGRKPGSPPPTCPPLVHDAYVTDGCRLYRVVSPFDPRDELPVALMEDCLTLELLPYSPAALYAMGLRAARPQAA